MNRSQIVDAIQETTGIKKNDIASILDAQDKLISDSLKRGEDVTLGKIGKLVTKHQPARTARNPQNGSEIQVPAKNTAKFKPSKDLLTALA